jgi:hypothetical protein
MYINQSLCWNSTQNDPMDNNNECIDNNNNYNNNDISIEYLKLFEKIIAIDPNYCDLNIQYIMAPPPPSPEDDNEENSMINIENLPPLGIALIFSIFIYNLILYINIL